MALSPSPSELFQTFPNPVLTAIAQGSVDAAELARRTLADRGFDVNGDWVGLGTSAGTPDTASVVIGALAQVHAQISGMADAFAGYDSDDAQTSRILAELWALVPSCRQLNVENLVEAWFDTQIAPED